jgi:tetratricopeptide (TPR) repeat protein
VAIEGASFITAYPRRPGVPLDEEAARLLAVREGIDAVLAGTIARSGSGYELRVNALNPSTGEIGNTASARAANKSDVLHAVASVAGTLRRALGDTTPPSQLKAETFTAGTLDAMRSYVIAQNLALNGKSEEAIQYYSKAVEQDPAFGRAYAGWAAAAYEMGRRDESRQLWEKALPLVDNMTERERYRTLGIYFAQIAQNFPKAIENYEKLVTLYPADTAGHSNLAVGYFYMLRFADALREGRRAIDLYPRSLKFRTNYALYAMYASDFKSAADESRAILKEDPSLVLPYLPLAAEALAAGNSAEAVNIYRRAAATGAPGASLAAIGLADVALMEKRFADAVTILEPAIDADRARKNSSGAAAKLMALAEAQTALGHSRQAMKAIDDALALSTEDATLVPAVRLLVRAGAVARSQALIQDLVGRVSSQSRAYAYILQAERSIALGSVGEAMDALAAARKLADVWLGRLVSGIAYETFGHRVEARDEFDTCMRRLGEVTAVFLDDVPTFRYVAELREWQQRVKAPPPGG